MKCPLTGKNCLKHKHLEAEGKLLCEDCFQKKVEGIQTANDMTCLSCETTLADIIKGGKLGCASCYDSFAETMHYIIGSAQMGDSRLSHVGRTPAGFLKSTAKSISYEEIREEIVMRMNSASVNQDYEKASKMKSKLANLDKIKKEGRADLSEQLAQFVFDFWMLVSETLK